jgi:pimeloyl-ACP methyl ester carboxylesterase
VQNRANNQVGCGNTFLASNDSCPPPEQLTPELYLHQIDALRAALSLERCHLYGQGVGGMLALSYAASRGGSSGGSSGVVSVTAASVAPSYKQLIADRRAAAKALLGDAGSQQLFQADGSSTVGGSSSAEWQQYVQQHVCRSRAALAPAGGCVTRVQQQQSQPVFAALAGGRYFEAAGRLADWSAASLDAAALQVCCGMAETFGCLCVLCQDPACRPSRSRPGPTASVSCTPVLRARRRCPCW